MDIDLDSLASDIVFHKQYCDFFNIFDNFVRNRFSLKKKDDNTFFERQFKNFEYKDIEEFINKKDTLYWYTVFHILINANPILFCDPDLKKCFNYDEQIYKKFINNLISTYINKIFELYELSNEEPDLKNFCINLGIFCKELTKYFHINFEKIHDNFGGFLMLSQNIEINCDIFNIYETLPQFQNILMIIIKLIVMIM